jgi:hypothetical protein
VHTGISGLLPFIAAVRAANANGMPLPHPAIMDNPILCGTIPGLTPAWMRMDHRFTKFYIHPSFGAKRKGRTTCCAPAVALIAAT